MKKTLPITLMRITTENYKSPLKTSPFSNKKTLEN